MQSSAVRAPSSDEPTEEEIYKACEKAALDLRLERAIHEQTREKLKAQEDIARIKDEQIAGLRQIVQDLKDANLARKEADAKTIEIMASFQRSLDAAEKRVLVLEAEIQRLKGQRGWIAVGAAVLGAAIALGVDDN